MTYALYELWAVVVDVLYLYNHGDHGLPGLVFICGEGLHLETHLPGRKHLVVQAVVQEDLT